MRELIRAASKPDGAAKAAFCNQGRIQYLLLGAASRRFRGAGVANRPLILRNNRL